jgi:hypothetical protein
MKSFFELHGSATTNATDCTNTSGWTPTEYFVDLVLSGIYQYGQLSGKTCVVGTDLAAGNGDTVNVRYVTARTHACSSSDCDGCLSAVSTSFSNYPVVVYPYGDYDKIQEFANWQAKGDIVATVADEMSKRMAACRDLLIWQALCAGTYTYTSDTTVSWTATPAMDSDCSCIFAFDLYNKIVDARQNLYGRGYNPTHVLIHPYVSAYLYYKENGLIPSGALTLPMVKFEGGKLVSILDLQVVEVKAAVADDASPAGNGDELAYVIDASRAIGEAWGMRPKFWEFYDGICNATELTLWQYWGTALMDTNAVVEIANP